MDKYPMTKSGYDKLSAELTQLKTVERQKIINAIAEAREHGDLKENAEYHSAREKQSFIEGRIKELEAITTRADVINPINFKESDSVKFGATVSLIDEDTEEEKTFQIVGEFEGDLASGKISLNSPIAKAMIGKKVEETVEVTTPTGTKFYEINKIEYK